MLLRGQKLARAPTARLQHPRCRCEIPSCQAAGSLREIALACSGVRSQVFAEREEPSEEESNGQLTDGGPL